MVRGGGGAHHGDLGLARAAPGRRPGGGGQLGLADQAHPAFQPALAGDGQIAGVRQAPQRHPHLGGVDEVGAWTGQLLDDDGGQGLDHLGGAGQIGQVRQRGVGRGETHRRAQPDLHRGAVGAEQRQDGQAEQERSPHDGPHRTMSLAVRSI
jgi:hypothetical protein